MATFSLPSFAKGELSPEVQGRIDISAYNIGLAEAKNVVVHTYGGVSRRPGLKFIGETKYNNKKSRLIKFQFKTVDTYILEVGEGYIRFIRNGAHVLSSRQRTTFSISYEDGATIEAGINYTITGLTQANPAVVTLDGTDGLEEGDRITLGDLDDLEELEGQDYFVKNLDTDAATCNLEDLTGSLVNSSALPGSDATTGYLRVNHGFVNGDDVVFSDLEDFNEIESARWRVYDATSTTFKVKSILTGASLDTTQFASGSVSYGNVSDIYTVYTDYLEDEVFEITYTQSADVMTLCHPNHTPMHLTRFDHDDWTFSEVDFVSDVDHVTECDVIGGGGTIDKWYKVTAVNADTGEEGLPGTNNSSGTISDIDLSNNKVKITTGAYAVFNRDEIEITGTGSEALDGKRFLIQDYDSGANTFYINDMLDRTVDGSLIKDLPSTIVGTVTNCFAFETSWSSSSTTTVSWTNDLTGIGFFNVYRRSSGSDYEWVGQTSTDTFQDLNIEGDPTKSPPKLVDPIAFEGDEPRAVGFYEQRMMIGGSNNDPDRSNYSRVGQYTNFSRGQPASASDAISAYLPSGEVDVIRHFLSFNNLLIFTEGAEWKVSGDSQDGFNIDTIKQRLQSRWGCGNIKPILVGKTIVWVTLGQSNVRSMSYDIVSDTYDSTDISVLSRHLFKKDYLTDWSWQRYPDSTIFCTRSDGKALALTFDTEQEVIAWSTLDTDGEFESIETLRQDGTYQEDSNYWVVQRTIDGNTVRYIEVSRDTYFDEPEDMFFVDSGITYDGDPTDTLTGAWHLAGADVVAVGDGDYVDDLTVSSLGVITLPSEMSKVHVGLGNVSRIKTLPLAGEGGKLIGEFKKISKATIKMYKSRKPWVGTNDSDLVAAKQREDELWGDPSSLLDGDIEVYFRPGWTLTGQITVEQPLPIAFSVTNVAPTFVTIDDQDI